VLLQNIRFSRTLRIRKLRLLDFPVHLRSQSQFCEAKPITANTAKFLTDIGIPTCNSSSSRVKVKGTDTFLSLHFWKADVTLQPYLTNYVLSRSSQVIKLQFTENKNK